MAPARPSCRTRSWSKFPRRRACRSMALSISNVGRGLVGGDVYSFAEHGGKAATLALQVLSGNTNAGFVMTRSSKVLFDWRQLQRWKISESGLPPGSEILFREPNVWETYRWPILAVCTVLLLQGGLYHAPHARAASPFVRRDGSAATDGGA